MNVKAVFGAKLKFYRKEKKLSQEQLSEKVEISVKHLSEVERGIVFASASLMDKLAESLDVPVFAFFLTDNNIFYDKIMLDRIEKAIVQNIEHTLTKIKKGNFQ